MQTYAFGEAEFHDRVGRGPPPMRFEVGSRAVVPEKFAVPPGGAEAGLAFFQFQLFPVKRDGGGVEKIAVQLFVPVVAFTSSKLVKVENVSSENKIVGYLLSLDLFSSSGVRKLKFAIRLAVSLNIGIDFFLNTTVSHCPVFIGKRGIDFSL